MNYFRKLLIFIDHCHGHSYFFNQGLSWDNGDVERCASVSIYELLVLNTLSIYSNANHRCLETRDHMASMMNDGELGQSRNLPYEIEDLALSVEITSC